MNYVEITQAYYKEMLDHVSKGNTAESFFIRFNKNAHYSTGRRMEKLAVQLLREEKMGKEVAAVFKPEPCSFKELLIPAMEEQVEVIFQSKLNKTK
jgi:hypothetical protein